MSTRAAKAGNAMDDPHSGSAVLHGGVALGQASRALVLLHGRGASAEDILSLGGALGSKLTAPGLALIAPQAVGSSWYPYSFLAPREQNEPWLSSALRLVASLVDDCMGHGIPSERIGLCGFSQGACLATEFVASHPRRYGALIAFTGGLIGPPGSDLRHSGSLEGMPALFSSGDPDPHVPWQRVEESAAVLREMGARVELMRHVGRPHTVLPAEIRAAQAMLQAAGF
jgi:phospholipase/carboxylesterase